MNTNLLKSIFLLVALSVATNLFAYDFNAVNADGVTIYYNILSESDKTCEVTAKEMRTVYSTGDYFDDYVGDVVIPSIVNGYRVTQIGRFAFACCGGLTSVTIPYSVTNIANNAFYCCKNLSSLNFPESIKTIGNHAVYKCPNLTSLVIPSSVTSIGEWTFMECTGLISITSYITNVFKTGGFAFNGCTKATLYVPQGLAESYRSTSDWSRIKAIEEIPNVFSVALACNDMGKVQVNDNTAFTNDLGQVRAFDGVDNTIVFTPNEGCSLKQVIIDGVDVTKSVVDNQLTTRFNQHSKMFVMFSTGGVEGDINHDGSVDISDVVMLVNMILGN